MFVLRCRLDYKNTNDKYKNINNNNIFIYNVTDVKDITRMQKINTCVFSNMKSVQTIYEILKSLQQHIKYGSIQILITFDNDVGDLYIMEIWSKLLSWLEDNITEFNIQIYNMNNKILEDSIQNISVDILSEYNSINLYNDYAENLLQKIDAKYNHQKLYDYTNITGVNLEKYMKEDININYKSIYQEMQFQKIENDEFNIFLEDIFKLTLGEIDKSVTQYMLSEYNITIDDYNSITYHISRIIMIYVYKMFLKEYAKSPIQMFQNKVIFKNESYNKNDVSTVNKTTTFLPELILTPEGREMLNDNIEYLIYTSIPDVILAAANNNYRYVSENIKDKNIINGTSALESLILNFNTITKFITQSIEPAIQKVSNTSGYREIMKKYNIGSNSIDGELYKYLFNRLNLYFYKIFKTMFFIIINDKHIINDDYIKQSTNVCLSQNIDKIFSSIQKFDTPFYINDNIYRYLFTEQFDIDKIKLQDIYEDNNIIEDNINNEEVEDIDDVEDIDEEDRDIIDKEDDMIVNTQNAQSKYDVLQTLIHNIEILPIFSFIDQYGYITFSINSQYKDIIKKNMENVDEEMISTCNNKKEYQLTNIITHKYKKDQTVIFDQSGPVAMTILFKNIQSIASLLNTQDIYIIYNLLSMTISKYLFEFKKQNIDCTKIRGIYENIIETYTEYTRKISGINNYQNEHFREFKMVLIRIKFVKSLFKDILLSFNIVKDYFKQFYINCMIKELTEQDSMFDIIKLIMPKLHMLYNNIIKDINVFNKIYILLNINNNSDIDYNLLTSILVEHIYKISQQPNSEFGTLEYIEIYDMLKNIDINKMDFLYNIMDNIIIEVFSKKQILLEDENIKYDIFVYSALNKISNICNKFKNYNDFQLFIESINIEEV